MSNPTPKNENGFKAICTRLLKLLLHNGGSKLLALLLALLLWAGLITQDPSLTRERTFSDVNVNVTGSETLLRNGFIVTSDLEEVLGDVTLRVAIPQMQYQNAQPSNYHTRIDLSRITEAGTQSVRITASNSSYGTVLDVSPAEVEITVEEYVTRYRIPVRVNSVGSAPSGYYASTPSADPPMIAVSGPRSLVDQIICAEATIELGTIPAREGLNRTAVPFHLLNDAGETIEDDLLEITSESVLLDSVVIEQHLYSLKTIPLSDTGLIRGTPGRGYEVKSVTITPENITVAGSADVLNELDVLYPESYMDISGLTESSNDRLRLRDPGGLNYTSTNIITVAVEIGPVIQSNIFTGLNITAENVGSGLAVTLGSRSASVTVSGPQLWLETLKKSNIKLICDASGLSEGTYQLPLLCQITTDDDQPYSVDVSPSFVDVTLQAK